MKRAGRVSARPLKDREDHAAAFACLAGTTGARPAIDVAPEQRRRKTEVEHARGNWHDADGGDEKTEGPADLVDAQDHQEHPERNPERAACWRLHE